MTWYDRLILTLSSLVVLMILVRAGVAIVTL